MVTLVDFKADHVLAFFDKQELITLLGFLHNRVVLAKLPQFKTLEDAFDELTIVFVIKRIIWKLKATQSYILFRDHSELELIVFLLDLLEL